jgi:hypothetical protein
MIVLALVVARVDYISDPCEKTGVTETYSGGRFDPFAPYSSDVNIEDVSAGLGHAFWRSCLLAVIVGTCMAHHSLDVSSELSNEGAQL